MPKNSTKKKKLYLRATREMAKKGMVNQPDGSYRSYSSTKDDSMRRDYMNGYHFGQNVP